MPCRICRHSHKNCKCSSNTLVEDIARKSRHSSKRTKSPFINKNNIIQYNCGVKPTNPTVLGSSTPVEYEGTKGYRPTHFTFDPSNGSLTSGTDVNNGWANVGDNTLITGFGNQAQADSSLVSGTNNTILGTTGTNACSILGGIGNNITSSESSAIIGCNNISLLDSRNTTVVGISAESGNQRGFRLFSNAILTDNVYSTNGITTGPIVSTKRRPPVVPTQPRVETERNSENEDSYTLDPNVWTGDVSANTLYAAGGVYGSSVWAGTSTIRDGWIPGDVYAAKVNTSEIDAIKVLTAQVDTSQVTSETLTVTVNQNELVQIGGDRIATVAGNDNIEITGNRVITSASSVFRTGEDVEVVNGSRQQSIAGNRISTIGQDEIVEIKNNSVFTAASRSMNVGGPLDVKAMTSKYETSGESTNVIGGQGTVVSNSTMLKVIEDAVDEIGRNRISSIKGSHYLSVEQDNITSIASNDIIEVGNTASLKTKADRILEVGGNVVETVAGLKQWIVTGESELQCEHLIDRVKTRADIYCPITEFYGDVIVNGKLSVNNPSSGVANVLESQPSSTSGGGSVVSNEWITRTLNIVVDFSLDISLSDNVITFNKSGIYTVSGFSTFYSPPNDTLSVARLLLSSGSSLIGSDVYGSGQSIFNGVLNIIAGDKLSLQYRVNKSNEDGLGKASELETNIYSNLTFTRLN